MVKFELRKVIENYFYFFLYMTLFDIAYRCCMLDKYGICNDGARGVSVAQWCDVRFVMRTQIFFFVPRSRRDE